jgi:hypothetical protein
VLKRLARSLVLLAAVQILGGHWMLLQSAAWVGMVIDYSHRESLPAAIGKTFDGAHPCALCKQIVVGKKHEKKSGAPIPAGKIDLICEPRVIALHPPPLEREDTAPQVAMAARFLRPLLQPPRLA